MEFSYLTVLPRGRQVWDDVIFPPEEFIRRKERVVSLMDTLDVDGLIIYSDGLTRRYVRYLTNYVNSVAWAVSLSLILRDREPIVMSTMAPRDVAYNKRHLAPGLELNAVGLGLVSNHHVAEKTLAYIKEKDLAGLRWAGVNLNNLPSAAFNPVKAAFPGLIDVTGDFDKVLARKSGEEIFAITQATAIAKKAALDYLRMAKPGENERRVAARIDRNLRAYGMDNVSMLVSAGKGNVTLRQPDDYIIAEGDTVSVQIAVMYLQYLGLFGSTIVNSGKESGRTAYHDSFMDRWNTLREKINNSKSLSGICSVSEKGYVLAQGIGPDAAEAPFDSEGLDAIENGSVFNLTMCENNNEFGGIFLSDTFACSDGRVYPIGGEGGSRIHSRFYGCE